MSKSKLRIKRNTRLTVKKQLIKHPQKSNLVTLFTLVLAIIALGSYLAYKQLVRPIGINEIGSPNSISCEQGFSDNFDGSTINLNYWTVETNDAGENVEISNKELVSTSPEGLTGLRLFSKNQFVGNFVSTIDIKTPRTAGNTINAKLSFLAFRSVNQGNYVVIGRDGNGQVVTYPAGGYYGWTYPNSFIKTANVLPTQNVTVKVVREGSHYKTYYKTSNDFILLGDFPDITDEPVTVRVNLGSGDDIRTLATTDSKDNFALGCIPENKPPTPSNPRSTCNPDGKSVRLMWDGVDSAKSYKVRVDDKVGKVTPFDGINKTEYIANISPNQTYSWWAHATKDGMDSAETPRLEFRCAPAATSTPTPSPKPTVKPTVAPTVTPTITPTATPSNSTDVSPTTQAQKFDLPIEPVSTPLPTKSTNPISRFFSWLASLFE